MKVMTILGTRPEIIRLSIIMKKLDDACDHVTLWTGQNYDDKLSTIFFEEFETRKFDYDLGTRSHDVMHLSSPEPKIISNPFYVTFGKMIDGIGSVLQHEKPDKVLILGDTNSSLAAAIVAERMGYPIYHMEAGNRCYDMKVPEEKNRIMIDSISSFNLPYVENSRENLLQYGYPKNRIFKCGNPIFEVMTEKQRWPGLNGSGKNHILVTAHRAENVDNPIRLLNIIDALKKIYKLTKKKIIFSVHPRTREKLKGLNYEFDGLDACEPVDFKTFIELEYNAEVIITDSGTVQEEACIFQKPCLIIRDSTERPETIEAGAHIVSGLETDRIVECFKRIRTMKQNAIPDEYVDGLVSNKVINFLLGTQL